MYIHIKKVYFNISILITIYLYKKCVVIYFSCLLSGECMDSVWRLHNQLVDEDAFANVLYCCS